jgi:hypothetical protein
MHGTIASVLFAINDDTTPDMSHYSSVATNYTRYETIIVFARRLLLNVRDH